MFQKLFEVVDRKLDAESAQAEQQANTLARASALLLEKLEQDLEASRLAAEKARVELETAEIVRETARNQAVIVGVAPGRRSLKAGGS